MHTAMLCNLLQAFSLIEGGHDTDAMLKYMHKYPVGHRLMIDMELIMDEDRLLQKVFNLQSRHYYPQPLHLHSKKTPLPKFTVTEDKKKKKPMSDPLMKKANKDDDEEYADNNQVVGALLMR